MIGTTLFCGDWESLADVMADGAKRFSNDVHEPENAMSSGLLIRWSDNVVKIAGMGWMRLAQDRFVSAVVLVPTNSPS